MVLYASPALELSVQVVHSPVKGKFLLLNVFTLKLILQRSTRQDILLTDQKQSVQLGGHHRTTAASVERGVVDLGVWWGVLGVGLGFVVRFLIKAHSKYISY